MAATTDKPLTTAIHKDEWRDFELLKTEHYNHNTAKFTFKLPDNTATLLPVASCVIIRAGDEKAVVDDKGNAVARPYTPISASEKPGEVEFLIKKYDTGKVTPFLHNLKPGEKISVKGPFPKHSWKSNEFDQAVLVAGGSGITPMYQILQHSLALPDDKTKFKLIFANVTEADILLREQFDAWTKQYPDRLETIYVLDKPGDNWKGSKGFVTAELLKEHALPPSVGEKVKIFVCGPPGQVAALAGPKAGMKQGELGGALKDLGYTSEQVYKF